MLHDRYRGARKTRVTFIVAAGLLAVAPVAVADWTSMDGSPRQLAPSGFRVEVESQPGELYPGASEESTVRITNPGRRARFLKDLTAEVRTVGNAASSEAEAAADSKCWAGWFEVIKVGGHPGSSYEFAETIAPHASVERGVTLRMAEGGANKNGCQRKTVKLEYNAE